MRFFRRVLSIALICAALMLASGCESSKVSATEPAIDPAAPFLEMAQSFVDQEDYDGAIAVLEQALETVDDPRLYTMLEEVNALREIPLTVAFSQVSSTLAEDELVVYNITAVHLHNSQVRYTLTYSAPEGMKPQLWGRNLFHIFPGETAGGLETITFEIADADVRKMSGQFQLAFAIPELHQAVFDVYTLWPGEVRQTQEESAEENRLSSFALSYWYMDVYENAGFKVNSFWVDDDGENSHFALEYTAQKAMEVNGYIGNEANENQLWTKQIQIGDGRLEFSVSNEDIARNTFLAVILTGDGGEAVDMSLDLPLKMLHTSGNPVGDPIDLGYTLQKNWNSDAYQIHSLTAVKLDNGYVRYALDMTLPKEAYFTVNTFDLQYVGTTILSTTTATGRQMFYVDILQDALQESVETTILLCEMVSRYENLITIPNSWITAMTEGVPISDPVELTWGAEGAEDYMGRSFTVQALDNDHYRFTMEFTAPGNQHCGVFDLPNGDNVKLKWITAAGQTEHTIVFDVSKETLECVTELAMYVNSFDDLLVTMMEIPEAVGSTAVPVEVALVSWETEGAE